MGTEKTTRSRGRPRTRDREGAITKAVIAYWENGPHTVSFNAMCQRIGMSKPSLYREFGSEDGLMDAALERYRATVVVPLLNFLGSGVSLPATVEQLPVALTADRGTPRGCLFTRMRLSVAPLGPLTTARLEDIKQERLDTFEGWFRRGAERGEANPHVSSELAAHYLDTQITTTLVHLGMGEPAERVRDQVHLALQILLKQPTLTAL